MSTVVNFGGKNYVEPGSYAFTKYNPTSTPNVATFGSVMIIDNGLSMSTIGGGTSSSQAIELAGGSGFDGEIRQGIKSVYEFNSYEDFKSFMGGGRASQVVRKLFDPMSDTPDAGKAGVPKIYYVRAATTVSAKLTIILNAENSLILTCKNEGLTGNALSVGGILKIGYQAKLVAKTNGITLQIWKGTFEGEDDSFEIVGTKSLDKSVPTMIWESDEYTTCSDLLQEVSVSKELQKYFLTTSTGDMTTTPNLVGGTTVNSLGGTTTFMTTADEFNSILDVVAEMDMTFFLCVENGVTLLNTTIATFIKSGEGKFDQFAIVPGGLASDDLFGAEDSNTSEYMAKYFDSEKVVVVHGAPEVQRIDGNGTKELNSIYFAASALGIVAGGAPQTPLTFKKIGYQNFVYPLKKKERIKALQAGILHVRNINGFWCINQGITTLQENKQMIALDGQSLELSIALIKAQLNKELILDGEIRFTGLTAAQADPISVKNFTETKLSSRVAKKGEDDLILSWKNVKITVNNSDYFVTYDFVPNVPVDKTFFVGNMLDFNF